MVNTIYNIAIIMFILVIGFIIFYLLFHKEKKVASRTYAKEYYSIDNLTKEMKEIFDQIQIMNVTDLNLNRNETEKREKLKSHLRAALRNCNKDKGSKRYVIDCMKDILQSKLNIKERTIDYVIEFGNVRALSGMEKFYIMYLANSKKYNGRTFEALCEKYNWDREHENELGKYYEITNEIIESSYLQENISLKYPDKLDCIVQMIYQKLYGLDACDLLIFDESIDEVAAGCGGITNVDYNFLEEYIMSGDKKENCYDSIWIIFHGKKIRMSCITFGNQKTLERVVKSISSNNEGRVLTRQNGYMTLNTDKQRISVACPPHSSSWVFYERNLNSVKNIFFKSLFPDKGNETLEKIIKILVKSNQSFIITGNQSAGKTTTLRSILNYIDQRLSIRAVESIFETQANNLMPYRNIQVMQEIGKRTLQEAITFFKKTSTDVTIMGELDETIKAGLLIQVSQSGGKFTLSTSHHVTTRKLIEYLRNALLEHTNLNDPIIAEKQVIESIRYDLHQGINEEGKRYIQRLTEIIPVEETKFKGTLEEKLEKYFEFKANYRTYETRNIIEWQDGKYVVVNKISEAGLERIKENLDKKDYADFIYLLDTEYKAAGKRGVK